MTKEEQSLFKHGLAGVVAEFANFLKANGFRIFQSSIHDALLSLRYVNLFNKQDVFFTLRANLVKSDTEWVHFQRLFESFWGYYTKKSISKNTTKEVSFLEEKIEANDEKKECSKKSASESLFQEQDERKEGIGYSPVSRIEKKEISLLNETDVQIAKLSIKRMAEPFKIQKSRRSKKGLRIGKKLDFPKIMRRSLKFEGYPLELFFKEKKKRLKRLIILADVSGSMERYASFVIPFILSIRGISTKAEVFVFSTSLTRITHIVKHKDIDSAIKKIGEEVPNWAGGTRIGFSLKQFNQWEGGRLLNKNSVVVILSDGWDLGSKEILKREMRLLQEKVYAVIWLNPILNDPNLYKMCKGMQIALPYIDYLLAVNNLESLKRVGKIISHLMLH